MYFEKAEQRGETIIRGDEIRRLNKIIIHNDDLDAAWIKYALGERMEGYVQFLDWDLFCISRVDGYGSSKSLYYHIESRGSYRDERGFHWKDKSELHSIDIRDTISWDKDYSKETVIRFLIGKLMEHYNISRSEIQKVSHPKKEKTIPRQQQTINLFSEMLDEVCKAQGLERIESQSNALNYNWVSIVATIGKKDRFLSNMYFHIIIGENGGIRLLNKSHAFSDVRSEWKGPEAMSQLQYMKRNPKYV